MKRKILLVLSIIYILICVCACGGADKAMLKSKQGSGQSGAFSGSSFGSALFEGSSSSAYDFSGAGTSFSLTNSTGYRIDSMVIRNSVNEYEIDLLSRKEPLMSWEENNFFCPMMDMEESDAGIEYTVEIKLENGTKFLLHDFPLGKSVKMLVVYEKNIGYLIYENLKNRKIISTLDNESILYGQNVVNAGNAYGEIQDPYSDYYRNPYADYDQPPVYVEPKLDEIQNQGAGGGCLDGGLFW